MGNKSKTQDQNIKSIEIIRWYNHIAWKTERIKRIKPKSLKDEWWGYNAFVKVSNVHYQKIKIHQRTRGQPLSQLGIRTLLSKITLLGDILF